MARRFKRSNFLFPQDLRPAQGDVSARPVDPFTRASEGTVEQAPQRPFEISRPQQDNKLMQLGRSLGIAAESAAAISNKQYEDYTQRAIASGATLAAEDERRGNKQSFKQLVSKTRVDSGNESARELMGMNPYVKKGFDATRARSVSLGFNAAIQSAYASNPVLDEASGLRLQDVDASDPRYQQWRTRFQQDFFVQNGVDTMNLEAQSSLVPAVQDAENRVNLAHDELRSERKLQDFEDSTAEFVSDALFDLNGNAEFTQGRDANATVYTAELLTAQLDEANALGYGGDDLQSLYKQIVASVINTATVTENPRLLEVLELIEVGNPKDRSLLMETEAGTALRPAIESAKRAIIDREFQQGQRNRTLRDQGKEDAMDEVMNQAAIISGMYETMGRTEEGREALAAFDKDATAKAAEFGFAAEWNSVKSKIYQEASDNQGVNIIDFGGMASVEGRIDSGELSGSAAKNALNDLMISGSLGNRQETYSNYLRLNGKIKASTDKSYAQFGSEVESAANQYKQVVTARLGFTQDERGRLVSIKSVLHGEGFSDEQIQTLADMSQSEVEAYIIQRQQAAALNQGLPISASAVAAINTIANEGINPLDMPDAIDPGDIERQVIDFENAMYSEFETFREREGRDMTPQEMGEYARTRTVAQMSGQLNELPSSNPLSARRNPTTRKELAESNFYNSLFEGISERTGDVRTTPVMDDSEVYKAMISFTNTGMWHPEITELADANGITPMELISYQTKANGVEIDVDFYSSIGIATPAASSDALPGLSVYSRTQDVSKNYAQGQYTVNTDFYIDDYSGDTYAPGSYDITLEQNGRVDVNVPAPFDGVVTEVWSESNSGGYGNGITIKDRATGVSVFMAHGDSVYMKVGDRVVKGQAVMKQGNTGRSFGEHIHIEFLDSKGNKIENRDFTQPIMQRWMSDIKQGSFLPGKSLNSATLNSQDAFNGGSNSLVARAIGTSEGTRTPTGGFTSAYGGHTDPGNGVSNQGSFSAQQGYSSPEEADRVWLAKLQNEATPAFMAAAKSLGLENNREVYLNFLDLYVQAPLAAVGHGGFLDQLGFIAGGGSILEARERSYINPNTGRLDAPGLGNNPAQVRADQQRRMTALASVQ